MTTKKFRLYGWDESATGEWSPETGLYRLRDDTPIYLAKWLWESGGAPAQMTATFELMAHGNLRKAAEVVRTLADQHILFKPKMRTQYGSLAECLFDAQLESLPASPEEYSLFDRVRSAINNARSK